MFALSASVVVPFGLICTHSSINEPLPPLKLPLSNSPMGCGSLSSWLFNGFGGAQVFASPWQHNKIKVMRWWVCKRNMSTHEARGEGLCFLYRRATRTLDCHAAWHVNELEWSNRTTNDTSSSQWSVWVFIKQKESIKSFSLASELRFKFFFFFFPAMV